ncbi:MAG: endopeptidase La [Nitrospina sp.]|mgnify:FL=1|jgi:ATP-dependent Lon protease|nr:endopeptidase La [Nitrospina sp.]MBT6296934.1 endopeptidase La [Nitrospina sp.]MBT6662914.1 endopeptidase La [Nitrospina sp.]MBT7521026.1 endopeptidase La [Nitrospina sp.]
MSLDNKLLPLLPLRDIVVFPFMVIPLFVGREKSVCALEKSMAEQKNIFLASQRKPNNNDPTPKDIYETGTIANILQILKLTDGTIKVLVEGVQRGRIIKFSKTTDFYQVEVEHVQENEQTTPELKALMRSVSSVFEQYVKLNQKIPLEAVSATINIIEPHRYSDTIAAYMAFPSNEKQSLLETFNPGDRLEKLLSTLKSEMEILKIEKKVHGRVRKQMERSQKEFYLNEQLKAIQKELGKRDEFKTDINELSEKIKKIGLPSDINEKISKELRRLELMQPMSAEATVSRTYIEWFIDLPWKPGTGSDKIKIPKAIKILDQDHYGLEKVKERIIEHLAMLKLVNKIKGPILCLAGPPGVGKTSLGRSIAKAIGKKFIRVSLGGVHDEAEIRGHRRTYIGALPGKIIQGIKKAGTMDPVFMLDEVDKMNSDFRGDPSSALLEVLDPEQNSSFNDHYLEADYDLSQVLFICTANVLHTIPKPLLDRMEIIRLHGYMDEEKVGIAEKFLIPKKIQEHGLTKKNVKFSKKSLTQIVENYTRESGVRNLEREIATICRKVARIVVDKGKTYSNTIETKDINKFLGIPKFQRLSIKKPLPVGVATGLAWTEFGGELLSIEVTVLSGTGKLSPTGTLGDVMKESAHAALSYVRSRAKGFGLENDFYQKTDIHIHIPEGAVPKDGPSAGITMAIAMVSALTNNPLRHDVAMTGELTLTGKVLPIGGLKEKCLAAYREGILKIILPKENEKDIPEIPDKIKKKMKFYPVSNIDEAMSYAFEKKSNPRKKLPKIKKQQGSSPQQSVSSLN